MVIVPQEREQVNRSEVRPGSRGIPENVGTPTRPKPSKCSACATPIWRWNGTDWVCYNCKYFHIVYERGDGDLSTLDGCKASGVYPGSQARKSAQDKPAQEVREVVEVFSPDPRPGSEQPAQANGQEMPVRNGVLTDTHLFMMRDGKLSKKRLPAQVSHIGDVLQICLDSGCEALWIIPGSELSDKATQSFIESEQSAHAWKINNPQYTDPSEYEDNQARCTYLMAWKRKEARAGGESGRELYIGYAEHNIAWGLSEVTSPVHLLGALTYLEDALQARVRYSPMSTGKHLMKETNKGERSAWVRPVDLSPFDPVVKTKVVDVRWKRELTQKEQGARYFLAADKNSMYPASCTSALLGSGTPEHVERPVFGIKRPLAGVYLCSVSGTSEFDGVSLPHPLQGLMYTEENGVIRGWFWTYTVKLLHELGYHVEIEEAYTWAESHTILRPWAEQLWNARAVLDDKNPLCNPARYKSPEARKLAYNAVKPVLNASLGLLDSVRKHTGYEGATDWYRPDWYALLKDNARYQMFWRIRSFLKKGYRPVGQLADCLCYAVNTDDHIAALPGMFDRWDKLGGYKCKFTRSITISQVAPLFANPLLDMGQINTTLIRYDEHAIEL